MPFDILDVLILFDGEGGVSSGTADPPDAGSDGFPYELPLELE